MEWFKKRNADSFYFRLNSDAIYINQSCAVRIGLENRIYALSQELLHLLRRATNEELHAQR
jgi:hypothetical protein